MLKLKLLDRKDREAQNPNASNSNLSSNLYLLKKNETNFVTADGSEESPKQLAEGQSSIVDDENLSYEYT